MALCHLKNHALWGNGTERKLASDDSQSGVSLMELLIVVTVLGTIAMLVYPKMILAMEDARLSAAAGDITTAMNYARLKATNTGRPSRVEFNVGTDDVNLERYQHPDEMFADVPTLDETVVEGGTFERMDHPYHPGVPYRLSLGGNGLFGGIDLKAAVFGGDTTLTFDASGAPDNGGTVTLSMGEHQRVIHVDALTGKVTVTD